MMAAGLRTIALKFTGQTEGLEKATNGADKALTKVRRSSDEVAESTDQLATKSSTLTGAFGALGSGLELVGLEKYGGALQAAGLATDAMSGFADLATVALESQWLKTIKVKVATIASTVAQKAAAAASKAWAAAQWLLNAALNANPIGLIVTAIGLLVGAFVLAWQHSQKFREIASTAFSGIASAVLSLVKVAITGFRYIADFFLTVAAGIVKGAAKAFGWVPGLGPKLKGASGAIDGFRKDVDRSLDKAINKVNEWQDSVNRMPKVIKLQGRIDDLTNKINQAKKKLRDPHLTRPQAAKIRADIRDLEAKKRKAQQDLNDLKNKTVTIRAVIKSTTDKQFRDAQRLHLFASGTLSAPRGLALVGENGPELVAFRGGEQVLNAGQTASAFGRPIIVENHIEVGGEVVRVVRTEIDESNRSLKSRVLAGAGARL